MRPVSYMDLRDSKNIYKLKKDINKIVRSLLGCSGGLQGGWVDIPFLVNQIKYLFTVSCSVTYLEESFLFQISLEVWH